ncbi:MAG: DUF5666 domain-containing protein [Candidatus Pacebacteria bacterium]|nr:DUF5666 domain-containing protein [Candidatus Paceibacterota bacterium]
MAKTFLSILLVVAIACLGAGFFAGWEYEKSQSPLSKLPQDSQQRFQRMAANANNAAGNGITSGDRNAGGFVNGEILSKDSQSITVKLRDGGSKIIFFATSTEVSKFASGNAADLSVGASVMVQGKANSDGSITAQTIQSRPANGAPAPANQ